MAVDRETVAEFIRQAEALPASTAEPYRALTSIAQVIAYQFTDSRAEGRDALADVELLIAALKLGRGERRAAARTLAQLHYPVELIDLLRGRARLLAK